MSCGCTTTAATTFAATASCQCSSSDPVHIDPKSVAPVISSEAASNKYSIETKLKSRNGQGARCSTYTGTAEGATNTDLILAIQTAMVDVVTDIIKGIIGEQYNGPVTLVPATHLTDLSTFQTYLLTDQTTGLITDATQLGYVNYIGQAVYQSFLTIDDHISGAGNTIVVCSSGSRLYQITIENCLFCFKLIYN